MIDCVAIVTKDGRLWSLPRPARHSDLIGRIAEDQGGPVVGETQGFLTKEGHFVDRTQAWEIVEALGQLESEGYFLNCGVKHPDFGRGRVEKVMPEGTMLVVDFPEAYAYVLTPRMRVNRCLIGSVLTSEDLWPSPRPVAPQGE